MWISEEEPSQNLNISEIQEIEIQENLCLESKEKELKNLNSLTEWWKFLRLITPVINVFNGDNFYRSFYSIPQFTEWRKKTTNYKTYEIEYLKGLGGSSPEQAKDYFANMEHQRIEFNFVRISRLPHSICEAELTAALEGWKNAEPIRQLLQEFGINTPNILHVDNSAAISIMDNNA
ncbi:hypothetical protein HUG17_6340 [Dermatophagoides farinae]|uniref:DNA topoisomerase (ATP-hydrolyzing) n=1 Tax=Dermatophagoides farinae TaxID=6954 RepID=A0A9D4P4U2_DERFA|nr:hypothetical protein HUG17_6340 [Dermatophagoides farinae]